MTALELMGALGEVDEELFWPALEAPARRKPRRALRIALIAAAVLALLALAALAASESGLLESLFPGKYDLIADYVTHVEAVAENDTLRLTLHEAVTDGTCALMLFSVERLDGGSIGGWSPDAEITPLDSRGLPVLNRSSSGRLYRAEGESRACYLWTSLGGADLTRVSVRLLGLRDRETGERLDGGSLTAEAVLDPCPVKLGERGVSPSGEELFVSIVLSPLSIRVVSWPVLTGMTPENAALPDSVRDGGVRYKVELLFRDGSREDITGALYRQVESASTGRVAYTGSFPELLDIGRVKAVLFDGVEYRLSPGEAPVPRGEWVEGMLPLEYLRSRTFGAHTPVYPAIAAASGEIGLALEGVWTDGRTTELLLEITAERSMEVLSLVQEGGWITFDARDKKGDPVPVAALSTNMADGLLGLVVECAGKAAELTVGDGDASITLPLDMKKLAKLPQIEPKEPAPRQTAAADEWETFRTSVCEGLFGGVTPDDTGYSADNGICRLTAIHLYLAEEPGIVRLRAWLEAERLDGEPYDMHGETLRCFEIKGLKNGGEVALNGGLGSQGGVHNGARYFIMNEDYRYGDFEILGVQGAGVMPAEGLDLETLDLDGLRLIWTPPEGGRITLDLPVTG
ncbi:MAG: hypothetical protein IKP17_04340 [Oscillospiraceae bacterium]|nr:hypothetical protein [Oscillospiraceae bacterium]